MALSLEPSIRWSPRAQTEFATVLEYLAEEWGTVAVHRFLDDSEGALVAIARQPFIGTTYHPKLGIRSLLIRKQVRLFYRVADTSIELISFADTRKDPANFKL